jgi:hypothetical protein
VEQSAAPLLPPEPVLPPLPLLPPEPLPPGQSGIPLRQFSKPVQLGIAMQALAMLTCDARFEQFCAVIILLALAQVDMQADMTAGEEASSQAASLLQAV